jgi:hypothetical protein
VSLTVTDKEAVARAVGVPQIVAGVPQAPLPFASQFKPAGSVPANNHVYDPVPPVAVNVVLYGVVIVAYGSGDVVTRVSGPVVTLPIGVLNVAVGDVSIGWLESVT